MKTEDILQQKKSVKDPTYCYVFAAACILFLHILFRYETEYLHEHLLIIPCLLLVGSKMTHRDRYQTRRIPWLSIIMVVWFILLQVKRNAEHSQNTYVGPVLSTYLFAFPLASLLQDGDEKKALRIFASAFLAAAAVQAIEGLLLILDCLPEFLSDSVVWDGSRLQVFWHPNINGCIFLIGNVFCSAYLFQAKSRWSKLGLCILIIIMLVALALTNSRTTIILTSGYWGATLFFKILKNGKKWFIPGIFAALALMISLYICSSQLYQTNTEALIHKYTQEYLEQISSDNVETTPSDAEKEVSAIVEQGDAAVADRQEETLPIKIDSSTGEISLMTRSPQGSLKSNLNSLNGRTRIWRSAYYAICDNPDILYWGTHSPGQYVSPYLPYSIPHLHNSWIECLIGMGLVGFIISVLFTLQTIWNCLATLLKNYDDVWNRTVALLALCLIAASVLEPYLFCTTVDFQPFNFLFFLCAGYLAHWQEEYNHRLLVTICSKIPFLKK